MICLVRGSVEPVHQKIKKNKKRKNQKTLPLDKFFGILVLMHALKVLFKIIEPRPDFVLFCTVFCKALALPYVSMLLLDFMNTSLMSL